MAATFCELYPIPLNVFQIGFLASEECYRPIVLSALVFECDFPAGNVHIQVLSPQPIRSAVLNDIFV